MGTHPAFQQPASSKSMAAVHADSCCNRSWSAAGTWAFRGSRSR